jgi:hypothetical protein
MPVPARPAPAATRPADPRQHPPLPPGRFDLLADRRACSASRVTGSCGAGAFSARVSHCASGPIGLPARHQGSFQLSLGRAAAVSVTCRGQFDAGPVVAGQEGQDFADGAFPAGGFGQGQVRLDLVAVAAAVLLLGEVAGCGQVGDDGVGAALGDVQAGGDVAQARARVVGDAQQRPGVVGQETPACRDNSLPYFPEKDC